MFKQIELNGEKWNYLIYDDNRLNNLEDVSQSENTKKAYIETFKKKTRKCRMKNLITHEEKRFLVLRMLQNI